MEMGENSTGGAKWSGTELQGLLRDAETHSYNDLLQLTRKGGARLAKFHSAGNASCELATMRPIQFVRR